MTATAGKGTDLHQVASHWPCAAQLHTVYNRLTTNKQGGPAVYNRLTTIKQGGPAVYNRLTTIKQGGPAVYNLSLIHI